MTSGAARWCGMVLCIVGAADRLRRSAARLCQLINGQSAAIRR